MADDVGPKWQVYPPPEPDELRVRVEAGENVELDENLRTAIENLANLVAEQEDLDEGSRSSRGALQVGQMDPQRLKGRPSYGGGEVMGSCIVNFCTKNSAFEADPGAIRS